MYIKTWTVMSAIPGVLLHVDQGPPEWCGRHHEAEEQGFGLQGTSRTVEERRVF